MVTWGWGVRCPLGNDAQGMLVGTGSFPVAPRGQCSHTLRSLCRGKARLSDPAVSPLFTQQDFSEHLLHAGHQPGQWGNNDEDRKSLFSEVLKKRRILPPKLSKYNKEASPMMPTKNRIESKTLRGAGGC